jgi:hypothetical protein
MAHREAQTEPELQEGDAVQTLCARLAKEALSKLEGRLAVAVRSQYEAQKDRLVEAALGAIARESGACGRMWRRKRQRVQQARVCVRQTKRQKLPSI